MAKIWGNAGLAMSPMSFGKSFDRMQGQPLDKSAVITDTTFEAAYAKAESFAASDSAYVGMVLSVSDGTTTKFYGVLDAAGTLQELGSNASGGSSSAITIVDETNGVTYNATFVLIDGQPAIRYAQV